jgi:hypothetical protein
VYSIGEMHGLAGGLQSLRKSLSAGEDAFLGVLAGCKKREKTLQDAV